jgi:hypothetical protein
MDPFGRQDKIQEEINIHNKNEEEKREKVRETEEQKRDEERKKLLKYFKNNPDVVDSLYDKLEKGELYNNIKECETIQNYEINKLNKESEIKELIPLTLKNIQQFFGGVVKLGGENIKVKIDEVFEDKRSRCSDSSNELMDSDVVCQGGECDI